MSHETGSDIKKKKKLSINTIFYSVLLNFKNTTFPLNFVFKEFFINGKYRIFINDMKSMKRNFYKNYSWN
jgi:hypothetical protein